jgi:toxin-antitoxin system PIN domain toxin
VIALLDVNVLIALAWPNHVHHAAAREWFEARRQEGWAKCPLTEAGFVRVSCNPSVVRHTVTPLDAIAVLQGLTRLGSHTFWPLNQSIMQLPESIGIRLQGYRQVTDAVLLATAIQRNGQLATLDAGMEGLVSESQRTFLCVIPV